MIGHKGIHLVQRPARGRDQMATVGRRKECGRPLGRAAREIAEMRRRPDRDELRPGIAVDLEIKRAIGIKIGILDGDGVARNRLPHDSSAGRIGNRPRRADLALGRRLIRHRGIVGDGKAGAEQQTGAKRGKPSRHETGPLQTRRQNGLCAGHSCLWPAAQRVNSGVSPRSPLPIRPAGPVTCRACDPAPQSARLTVANALHLHAGRI